MSRQKLIIFTDGAFKSFGYLVKDAIVSTIRFNTGFSQVVANQMGIKRSMYDESGALLTGLRKWDLDYEEYGVKLKITPMERDQSSLFGGESGHLEIDGLSVNSFKVIKLKDNEGLRLTFDVDIAEQVSQEVHNWIYGIKRNRIRIEVELPSKERRLQAMRAAEEKGATNKKKKDTSDDEDDNSPDAAAQQTLDAGQDDDPESAPPDLKGSALAAWQAMHPDKKRVPARRSN